MPDINDENGEPPSVKSKPKNMGGVVVSPNDSVSIYLSFLRKQLGYVDMGQTCFASGNNAALGTGQLASCYALIVISQNNEGVALFGLNHWIGDEIPAEEIIIQMKNELLKRGAQEDQFKCLAIGGHVDFPDMKNEIQVLVHKGLIHDAIFDLNSSNEHTALIVNSAPGNKIFIEYETKEQTHTKKELPAPTLQQEAKDLPSYLKTTPVFSLKERLIMEAMARLKTQIDQQSSTSSLSIHTEASPEELNKKPKHGA